MKKLKNKAKLVTKGFLKEPQVDYQESFSLVTKLELTTLVMAIATNKKMEKSIIWM